jgi:vesicle transport through interaction with t-SNAREs 1
VQELEADMAEAEALVRRMDLEARSLPVTVKTPLLAKLKEYKQDLATLKREAKAATAAGEDDNMREELLSRSELGTSPLSPPSDFGRPHTPQSPQSDDSCGRDVKQETTTSVSELPGQHQECDRVTTRLVLTSSERT